MRLIKDLGLQYPKSTSKQRRRYGLYECPQCKKEFKAQKYNVKNGRSTKCRECGDSNSGTKRLIHGENSKSPLYSKWVHMRQRINNRKDKDYIHYGGRGIKICDEWSEYLPFKQWALNNGYKAGLTIHRIDNDGDYEPSNCTFTNQTVQTRVTRKLCKKNTSGYRGVSKNKKAWCATISVNYKRVHIGSFKTKEEAARAYDEYILKHNLEHTLNFEKDNDEN